mgnify:CR=1 FL=1
MAKKAKELVAEVTEKITTAAKETAAENGESVKKEAGEAKAATKSFFKEVGEMFVAIFKAIGNFFKKLKVI